MSIEKGDPHVAVGSVFEAANTVGVPLLGDDVDGLEKATKHALLLTALLPKRARSKKEDLDDNF